MMMQVEKGREKKETEVGENLKIKGKKKKESSFPY